MVKIINGCKEYKGKNKTIALKNINLTFPETGLIEICGASGSGKTTLLNCIAGLDKLTSGEIIGCKKEDVGFIFQDYALIDNMSIYDNLKIAYDISNKELSIEQALTNVNIDVPLDKKVNELSGGQKQRVAIARALIISSKIIIADEPTGNLDNDNSITIAKLLKDISKNKLVIVVTHDKTLFEDYADRIIVIDDGQVVSDSTIMEIQEDKVTIENNNKRKLRNDSVFKLYFYSAKHSLSRIIIGILILFLAMFSIMTMLNTITTSKNNMLFNSLNEYNINILNFSKRNKYNNESLIDEDFNDINNIYGDYSISYTSNYNAEIAGNRITINRLYVDDIVKEKLIYGRNNISNNETVISYALAKTIQNLYSMNNINDVIGLKININNYELNICGITEKIKLMPNNYISKQYKELYDKDITYIYLNSITINNLFYANIEDYSSFNTNIGMNNPIYNANTLTDFVVSEGSSVLNDGEIILDETKIIRYCNTDDKTELLNKIYNFEFRYDGQKIKTYSLKVVGFGNYTAVNTNTYLELFKYSNEYHNLTRYIGIGVYRGDLSIKLINKFQNIDITTDYFLQENIESSYSITNFLAKTLAIVIIPIIIIVVLYLINYSKQNIILKRKQIGILKSLGFSNYEISKIFVLDSLFLVCLSAIITLIFSPLGIYFVNKTLRSNYSLFNPISYNPIFILILVVLVLLIIALSLCFNLLRLNKKTDVDLVYGR